MLYHWFGDLSANAERRVERRKRILKHGADASSEHPPAPCRSETDEVLAFEPDRAGDSASGPRKFSTAPAKLLLPDPDSPTMASEPPGLRERLTSRTAVICRS